jgi:hypothetical protein
MEQSGTVDNEVRLDGIDFIQQTVVPLANGCGIIPFAIIIEANP